MSEHITHTESTKRLERSSDDRMVAGVSVGLGRYFDLNPAFFRLGFVVLTLLGGAGILIYIAAVLVIPEEGKERSIAEEILARRQERPWPLVGLGLAGVAIAVLVSRAIFWPTGEIAWVLLLLGGLAILWSYDATRGDRRSRILVSGLVALFVTVIVAVVAAVSIAFAWFDVGLGDGLGDRTEAPATLTELQPTYELGVGSLRVDLSGLENVTEPTHVLAKVGIGELRIVLPPDVPVTTSAHAKVGEVYVFDQHEDGRNAEIRTGSGLLEIEAKVGAGRIDITRAVR